MRLDAFSGAAVRGLYGFVSYPVRVTVRTPGLYVPGAGQSPGTLDTRVFKGLVTKWQQNEIKDTNVPFTSVKLVLLRCDTDPACAVCFEPLCGAYKGCTFRLWKDGSGPFLQRDDNNTMLTFAVTETGV